MEHCSGGPGAWEIGQFGRSAPSLDVDKNVLVAMIKWVEMGEAPEGVKYLDDDKEKGEVLTRRHCRYPFRNAYDRIGDPSKLESWRCEMP
ncbi:hypothetical protein PM082_016887 [Marasmius tenuissimus]|nr:hypothetical protein PM082_016887 [Marasmius tenuissimus]